MKMIFVLFILMIHTQSFSYDRLTTTVGGGVDEQQLAIDGSRFWRMGESKFYLGTGVRLTSQWSNGQTFRTAPARLTRGTSGLGAIIKKEIDANIDELTLGHSHITSLNVLFQALYQHNDNWSLGFNIDVIGVSYGEMRKGRFNPKSENGQWPEEVSARPSEFNLLLGDDNDLGSLNSELYIMRKFKEGWSWKLGIVHAFTEYRTTQKLRNNNDRFRKKNFLPTFGISKTF